MRRGFGLIGLLVTAIVLVIVGAIAYNIGWSEGVATHLPANTVAGDGAPYYYGPHYWGGGFGFGLFGIFWFLLILVVDDEPRIVQLVRDYLEHGGFTVLTASDGQAALRTARTGRPDLVVLDLSLPGLDGLDVARSLRREGEVPIIMLTARTEESDK